ncbi:MAG: hypothetical protein ACYCYK_12615 [Candidatus Dormibacteria bacterium]
MNLLTGQVGDLDVLMSIHPGARLTVGSQLRLPELTDKAGVAALISQLHYLVE